MPQKKQIRIYFDYLDEQITLCGQKKIKFETIDRALYQFDKDINGVLPNTRRRNHVEINPSHYLSLTSPTHGVDTMSSRTSHIENIHA
jgi:hypothetical protein